MQFQGENRLADVMTDSLRYFKSCDDRGDDREKNLVDLRTDLLTDFRVLGVKFKFPNQATDRLAYISVYQEG
jgi:hypothetical protein